MLPIYLSDGNVFIFLFAGGWGASFGPSLYECHRFHRVKLTGVNILCIPSRAQLHFVPPPFYPLLMNLFYLQVRNDEIVLWPTLQELVQLWCWRQLHLLVGFEFFTKMRVVSIWICNPHLFEQNYPTWSRSIVQLPQRLWILLLDILAPIFLLSIFFSDCICKEFYRSKLSKSGSFVIYELGYQFWRHIVPLSWFKDSTVSGRHLLLHHFPLLRKYWPD